MTNEEKLVDNEIRDYLQIFFDQQIEKYEKGIIDRSEVLSSLEGYCEGMHDTLIEIIGYDDVFKTLGEMKDQLSIDFQTETIIKEKDNIYDYKAKIMQLEDEIKMRKEMQYYDERTIKSQEQQLIIINNLLDKHNLKIPDGIDENGNTFFNKDK